MFRKKLGIKILGKDPLSGILPLWSLMMKFRLILISLTRDGGDARLRLSSFYKERLIKAQFLIWISPNKTKLSKSNHLS